MNRVSIGQHVEIKRSDGRVHTAIVVGLSEPEQLVKVEWFEQVSLFSHKDPKALFSGRNKGKRSRI